MAHQVNPSGFRAGKTFLWDKNDVTQMSNNITGYKNINLLAGVSNTINQVLQRNNLYVTKITLSENNNSGTLVVRILYYHLITPLLRNRPFPLYLIPRSLLNKVHTFNKGFKSVVSKIWISKTREFNNRFVRIKRKKNLHKLITSSMFYGIKSFLGFKNKTIYSKKQKFTSNYFIILNRQYLKKKQKKQAWKTSKKPINARQLAKQISKRVGIPLDIKLKNIFSFINTKTKKLSFKKHQRHIWNKRYHFNKKRFTSYYDIVNSFYILCHIKNSESFVLKMIQYGLINMHRRKIRPKNMFYFLNSIVKNMKLIQKNFNAIRLVITGKLRGGTSRTQIFSTGFGILPKQTLDKNINYVFGDVRSKYGAFGVKIFTWRKSIHETITDLFVKWTLFQQSRANRQKLKNLKKYNKKQKIKILRKVLFSQAKRKLFMSRIKLKNNKW